jgi:predicted glutamine amidotransferase
MSGEMCRLFGFRSSSPSPVHSHLVLQNNSLHYQSREHKDGWGIAHYGEAPVPSVVHSLAPAHSDPEFERVCKLLESRAIVAHVRLASVGPVQPQNAHPFTYGRWSFAHNGTLRDFAKHQSAIEAEIHPRFRVLMRGETDSERCFYAFLTQLAEQTPVEGAASVEQVARALARVTRRVSEITDVEDGQKPSTMNFLVSDGEVMVSTRRNNTLYFSECRRKGADVAPPADGARLERLLIASEHLSVEDAWFEVPESSVLAVDPGLTLRMWSMASLS